ncbi:MAG: flagellar biosynthetic protein FliO [Pseudomonadota bacterium]
MATRGLLAVDLMASAGDAAPAAGLLLQMLVALVVVVGLIYALGWLLKRLQAGAATQSGSIRMLGGLSVGARERVVLLELDGKRILLGVTSTSVSPIVVLGDEAKQPTLPGVIS